MNTGWISYCRMSWRKLKPVTLTERTAHHRKWDLGVNLKWADWNEGTEARAADLLRRVDCEGLGEWRVALAAGLEATNWINKQRSDVENRRRRRRSKAAAPALGDGWWGRKILDPATVAAVFVFRLGRRFSKNRATRLGSDLLFCFLITFSSTKYGNAAPNWLLVLSRSIRSRYFFLCDWLRLLLDPFDLTRLGWTFAQVSKSENKNDRKTGLALPLILIQSGCKKKKNAEFQNWSQNEGFFLNRRRKGNRSTRAARVVLSPKVRPDVGPVALSVASASRFGASAVAFSMMETTPFRRWRRSVFFFFLLSFLCFVFPFFFIHPPLARSVFLTQKCRWWMRFFLSTRLFRL